MHRWFLSVLLLGCVIASRWGYTLIWSEAGVIACALRRKEHASCGIWILSKLGLFSRHVVTFSSKNLRLHCAVFYFPHIILCWIARNSGSAATSQIRICLGVTGIPPPFLWAANQTQLCSRSQNRLWKKHGQAFVPHDSINQTASN